MCLILIGDGKDQFAGSLVIHPPIFCNHVSYSRSQGSIMANIPRSVTVATVLKSIVDCDLINKCCWRLSVVYQTCCVIAAVEYLDASVIKCNLVDIQRFHLLALTEASSCWGTG